MRIVADLLLAATIKHKKRHTSSADHDSCGYFCFLAAKWFQPLLAG